MTRDEGDSILEAWLGSAKRTLQEEQKEAVLNKFEANGLPLYLRLVFEEAKSWKSFDGVPGLKTDVEAVLEDYFEKLQKEHGKLLIERFCSYLPSGKDRGLSEGEILDLLSFDSEYWNDFYKKSHPAHRIELERVRKLPVAVWSRLYLDLEPYLTTREGEGGNILTFYHRQFTEYAQKRYLTEKKKLHSTMADYFETLPLFFDDAWKQPNGRKCAEQPYQQMESEQWDHLADKALGNFPFAMAKVMAGLLESLFDDYRKAFQLMPQGQKEKLKFWEAFFRERAHILRRGNLEWPSYKILLQLAVEHADESPVTKGAERYLEQGNVDWVWIKRMQRVRKCGIDPCIEVLETHANYIDGALELRDGRILSWSLDGTLHLWNINDETLEVLKGSIDEIVGALELSDNRILSWSWDKTLRLWNRNGKLLKIMKGHTDVVYGALELHDRRLLSWSWDKTLRLWNNSGKPLKVMKEHTERVRGALELSDNRILSWSWDETLRLWDKKGKPLKVMEGHTGEVVGAIELRNGRILSWNLFNTLRLWERNGESLELMKGHHGQIMGAIELQDGRILSWACGETPLRLWNNSGKPLKVMRIQDNIYSAIELRNGRILSGSEDGNLQLWEDNGELLELMEGHSYAVRGVLELRDGRILSWASDGIIHLWNSNGKLLQTLKGEAGAGQICGVIELHDGRLLSWRGDEALHLWNKEGKPIEVIQGHAGSVDGLFELWNGRIISWSMMNDTLHLWDRDGKPLEVLEGHTEGVVGTIELHDGRILSWSWDKTLRLWNSNGESLEVMKGSNDEIMGVLELRDGRILSWSWDGTLHLWNSNGKLLKIMKGHTKIVDGALELRDGRILSWSWDGTLHLWNSNGESLEVMEGSNGEIGEIVGALELRDGRILSWTADLTKAGDKSLHLWDSSGQLMEVLKGHTEGVVGTIELHDGRILSWSWDKTLRLWNSNGKHLKVLKGHASVVRGVLELCDGRILSWAEDNAHHKHHTLHLWDSLGQPLEVYHEYKGLSAFPECRMVILGKKCILSGSGLDSIDNTALIIIFDNEETHRIPWHGTSKCTTRLLKPDGRMIVTQENGRVCFLRLYHGNKQITIKELEEMYGLEYRE